ncbi:MULTISPECIES: hypothetical protein [Allobacillus]|uniref:Membrane-anchored protein n=1 Tax=Allobacillus halotolerans TaxID=570278 RepID=A0ABS6GPC0_9BACI|nr:MULTISPECIES: hypothetical protein [Allobacillus]MBU6080923.1 hypothetical protein [Allobacillus halotolerans]TSJ66584.1 hypothetical protein FPQ10_06970 [Allobacillus sp. SKP2-8]
MTHRREIDDYVDELYAEAHETERVKEKKEEISMKLSESMREFEQSGVSDQDAFEEAIVNTKNLQGFTDRCENKNILDGTSTEQHVHPSMTNKLSIAGMVAGIGFLLLGIVMSMNISLFGIYTTAAPAMFFYAVLGGMLFTYSLLARKIRVDKNMTHQRAALYACAVGAMLFAIFVTITVGYYTSNWLAGIVSFALFFIVGLALFMHLLFSNEAERNQ